MSVEMMPLFPHTPRKALLQTLTSRECLYKEQAKDV